MITSNLNPSEYDWKRKLGPLLLIIGLVSLAQATNILQLGAASYPEAIILTAIGGAFTLESYGRNHLGFRALQWVLALIAIALIVIF